MLTIVDKIKLLCEDNDIDMQIQFNKFVIKTLSSNNNHYILNFFKKEFLIDDNNKVEIFLFLQKYPADNVVAHDEYEGFIVIRAYLDNRCFISNKKMIYINQEKNLVEKYYSRLLEIINEYDLEKIIELTHYS